MDYEELNIVGYYRLRNDSIIILYNITNNYGENYNEYNEIHRNFFHSNRPNEYLKEQKNLRIINIIKRIIKIEDIRFSEDMTRQEPEFTLIGDNLNKIVLEEVFSRFPDAINLFCQQKLTYWVEKYKDKETLLEDERFIIEHIEFIKYKALGKSVSNDKIDNLKIYHKVFNSENSKIKIGNAEYKRKEFEACKECLVNLSEDMDTAIQEFISKSLKYWKKKYEFNSNLTSTERFVLNDIDFIKNKGIERQKSNYNSENTDAEYIKIKDYIIHFLQEEKRYLKQNNKKMFKILKEIKLEDNDNAIRQLLTVDKEDIYMEDESSKDRDFIKDYAKYKLIKEFVERFYENGVIREVGGIHYMSC